MDPTNEQIGYPHAQVRREKEERKKAPETNIGEDEGS